MKYYHMRWVLHMLSPEQEARREEFANSMPRELRKHEMPAFHCLFTGDHYEISYSNLRNRIWVADMCDLDQVHWNWHRTRQVIIAAFFNDNGEWTVHMMKKSRTMDSQYFTAHIVSELTAVCCLQGRRPCQRRRMLHFDHTLTHKRRQVEGSLEHFEQFRLEVSA
jgi:hypothetical protein